LTLIKDLVRETLSWETVMTRFVVTKTGDDGEDEGEEGEKKEATAIVKQNVVDKQTVVDYSFRGSFSRPAPK
jgi:hypothetical protein